ncbi:MAG: NADH-quinone oxidoreductase subunit C [Chthoniobacterales bacterium]
MDTKKIQESIEAKFPGIAEGKNEFRGEVSYALKKELLHEVCAFCRDSLGFDYLLDIASVDHFGEDPRFEVVYELYSLNEGNHLRLKTKVSEDDLEVVTISDIWPTADWHEREIYDMMGIGIKGHPDLRRILMWEGYPYFPLRKDFPLEGKKTDVHEVAFTDVAPLAGGPFVTEPTTGNTQVREPRAHPGGEPMPGPQFIAEP